MLKAPLSFATVFLFLIGLASAYADETLSYTWQGVTRTAIVHAPIKTLGHPAPLVIALYGSGDNAKGFQEAILFDRVADQEGFIVVYPDAIDGRWNYGRAPNGNMPLINNQPVDDIGFLRTMISDLVERKLVDKKRIFATGFSRGGLMTFTLACALSDKIAAIATIAGSMTEAQMDDCKPTHLIPTMMINGTSDDSVFYDGHIWSSTRLVSIPETLNYWRRQGGCSGQDKITALPHLNKNDHTRASLINWTGCKTGTGVRFYRIDNGGHSWPRLVDPNNPEPTHGQDFGGRNGDFETPVEIWNFFKQYQHLS
ncbi:PHB depolymerase family esterase [Rhizobium sp.]|uniref:alpha/beta hydrolase family esterase n=1 Tax=Rhizobium sp. TaxID=391 RepID=UPI002AA633EA